METLYQPGNSLYSRAMSAFPLSIGTSLAMESVFQGQQAPYDPDRKIPDQLDVSQYQKCYINIATLFRNLVSAITKETLLSANPEELASILEDEIAVIQGLFQNEGRGVCQPVFYYSTYSKLKSKVVPGLSFRDPSTDQQKHLAAMMANVLRIMEKHTDSIRVYTDAIEADRHEAAFVLTHHPYDLTSYKKFSRLDLLESNTGVVKPRARWSSKYCPMSGQDFSHLPFTRKLLLIFGDKSMIKPMPPSIRKTILETSLKRNWNPATTDEKIKIDLGFDIRDPYTIAVLNAL